MLISTWLVTYTNIKSLKHLSVFWVAFNSFPEDIQLFDQKTYRTVRNQRSMRISHDLSTHTQIQWVNFSTFMVWLIRSHLTKSEMNGFEFILEESHNHNQWSFLFTKENFPVETELMSEKNKRNPLQRCILMQSLNLKYIARIYSLYVVCPEAPALVQVMEKLLIRWSWTQDCWYYDGSCNEAGGKSYVGFKKLQHVHSVKTAMKTQLSNTIDCSGTGLSWFRRSLLLVTGRWKITVSTLHRR